MNLKSWTIGVTGMANLYKINNYFCDAMETSLREVSLSENAIVHETVSGI